MDEIANYSNGPVSGKPVKSGKKLFEQVKEGLQNGKAPPAQVAPASITQEDAGLDDPKRDPVEKAEAEAKAKATEKAVKDATAEAKKSDDKSKK